jgi:glycosyltransferase involved in cell wall biosynthesis
LKVGIDYTSAVHQGAGIGRLTRDIVRALAEIDRENEYTLLVQGQEIAHPPRVPDARNVASGIPNDNVREVRTWIDERWWNRIWHRLHLPVPVEWAVGPVDLFHSPDFTLPPVRRGTRTMVTVHDLSFLRLPECFEPTLRDYLTANVPRAVRRADWVLADSESTRRDLVELIGASEDCITVIYPGVEPRFDRIADTATLERVRRRYGLPDRFILSLGTVQPRKNYVGLIKAFADLDHRDVSLVIVGGKGWLYEEIFASVQELNVQDRVIFAGFVDDADLPEIYNLAEIFCLPSLYEGFGIPPLEAMACGTPVITADNSSLPEVVGNAGILVDARDQDALGDALDQLLADPARRRTLTERGIAQAAQFTWPKAAQRLLATYRQLCER